MSNYIVKIKKDSPLSILAHHGIKGQKWGIRRFQEDDGSLTEAGRKRYSVGDGDKTTPKKESFKPGDDGYEIHDAPKSNSDSKSSKAKPDIEDVDFEDKTGKTNTETGKTNTETGKTKTDTGETKTDTGETKTETGKTKTKKAAETLNAAKSVANDSSTIARELGNVAGRKSVNVPRLNLSHMTNKEMQDAIQREIIEKQYDQMFNTSRQKAEARKERTQTFLQNTGSALAITGSALGIALTITKLLEK